MWLNEGFTQCGISYLPHLLLSWESHCLPSVSLHTSPDKAWQGASQQWESVWDIYSNLSPEEKNVLLTLCYCYLFVYLRLLILCLSLGFALEKRASAGWALKHILHSSLAKQKLCEILYLLGVKSTDISYNVFRDSRRTCLQHFCLERFGTAFCLQAAGTLKQGK